MVQLEGSCTSRKEPHDEKDGSHTSRKESHIRKGGIGTARKNPQNENGPGERKRSGRRESIRETCVKYERITFEILFLYNTTAYV